MTVCDFYRLHEMFNLHAGRRAGASEFVVIVDICSRHHIIICRGFWLQERSTASAVVCFLQLHAVAVVCFFLGWHVIVHGYLCLHMIVSEPVIPYT